MISALDPAVRTISLYVTLVNLASVLRAAERPDEALRYDDQGRKGLIRIYGDQHPFTLAASINYASDLAACGRLGEASSSAGKRSPSAGPSLGDDHPDTLMAAANLAFDEAAAGDEAAARTADRRRARQVRARR